MGMMINKNSIGRVLGYIAMTLCLVVGIAGQATAATHTLSGNATWGTAANGMVGSPTAEDNVIIGGTATFTVNAAADAGNIGNVTAAGAGVVVITVGSAADHTRTIASIDIAGAGTVTFGVDDQSNNDLAATVTGVLETEGNLVLSHVEPGGLSTNLVTVNGAIDIGGTTTITGGNHASASTTTLVANANATFDGLVTVTGSTNAAALGVLTLNGTTIVATAGILLQDNTALTHLNVTGAGAQTITGAINGGADGEGKIFITDSTADEASDLKTFESVIGTTNDVLQLNVGSSLLAGAALFKAQVDATTITLTGGSHADEDATAEFQDTVTATAIVLDDSNTGQAIATFNATNGAKTIAGTVNGNAGNKGSIVIIDDDAGAAPDLLTFSGRIGQTGLLNMTVGSSTQGGAAKFTDANAQVADQIKIIGGDHVDEDSSVEFQGAGVTAVAVVFDDNHDAGGGVTGATSMTVNATNGAGTVAGTINGTTDGDGTLNVIDDDSGESHLVTFSGIIGATKTIGTYNIGTATQGGNAIHSAVMNIATATNITGGDHANEDNQLEITATGTSALGAVTLDDNTGDANLKINTTNGAATITGTIDGNAAGVGSLIILDDDNGVAGQIATISGNVGSTYKLEDITVGTANSVVGNATFSGTVTATTITVNGGNHADEDSLVTMAKDVTATTINVNGTTNASATTTIVDVNADITSPTINITAGTGDAGADATLKVTGDITASTLFVLTDGAGQGTSLLDVDGTAAQTITGAITATASGNGDVTVNNAAGVTFANNIGAVGTEVGTVTVAAGKKAIFDGQVHAGILTFTADAATHVTINDVITVDSGGAGTGAFNLGAGTTIVVGEGFASGATIITADGAAALGGGTITIDMPTDIDDGENLKVLKAASGLVGAHTLTPNALYTYAGVYTGATDYVVTATKRTAAATATNLGITESAATALYSASRATDGDSALSAIISQTLNAGGAAATQLADQVQGSPEGLSSTSGAAVAATGASVVSVGSARMASLRNGNAYATTAGSGFNAGSIGFENSLWMKPFASFGKQTERKSIAGYDQDTYGIAIGADTRINAHSVMGLSFSFADTDVDGRGAGRAQSEIGSYQLTAYGDYTAKDYYVEALVGYAYNDIDTSRTITATSALAEGETSSNQFMFSLSGGMPMKAGHNSYFTPSVGINFTHVVNDSYTETGAGNLNLRINPEDITLAKTFLGGRYHAAVQTPDGVFTPELRARVIYDMAGDDGSSSNTFTGGGAAFDNNGIDVVEFSTSVGAGLAFTPSFDQGMNLSVNYDFETKTNFTGHSANFQLRYAF